jgi:hypothetical protein
MPVQRRIGTIVVAGLLTALVACGAPTTNKWWRCASSAPRNSWQV